MVEGGASTVNASPAVASAGGRNGTVLVDDDEGDGGRAASRGGADGTGGRGARRGVRGGAGLSGRAPEDRIGEEREVGREAGV